MAKVLGKSGRYTSQEAARHRKWRLELGFILIGLLGIMEGVCLSTIWSFLQPPPWLSQVMLVAGAGVVAGIAFWGLRELDAIEAERRNWQRGTDGETVVGKILATLPDEFHVINDLKTPGENSNLDHVVVGPTGVFVLDAKNWRGAVTADGKGELLLNGKPTDKTFIRVFVGRIMGVKEKVRTLAAGTDPYFQGLFVFTAARVEAAWGKTGRVNCLREDQLRDYIVDNEFGKGLKPEEVQRVAQAFKALAQMDPDFTDKVTEVLGHKAVAVDTATLVKA